MKQTNNKVRKLDEELREIYIDRSREKNRETQGEREKDQNTE